jgi:hypothetical protein
MMIKRGQKIFGFIAVALIALSLGYIIALEPQTSSTSSDTFQYDGYVCVSKNGELIECSHNLLYNNGMNITRNLLGVGGNYGGVLNISLCNATAGCGTPVVGATETFNTYVNCGLHSQQGTYAVLQNAPGNWSVSKTFTSSCNSIEVNSTRLANETGSLFASNTFTLVTLQTNDQLTINWTLMVS